MKTDRRIHPFIMMVEGGSQHILARLQAESVGFADLLERDEYEALGKFDMVLGMQIYTCMRSAAFAFPGRERFEWLSGETFA